MRARAEILLDGIRKTDNDVTVPAFADNLSLLTLEVMVDIRDILATYIKSAETLQERMFPKT